MLSIIPRRTNQTCADIFVGAFWLTAAPPTLCLTIGDREPIAVDTWRMIDGGTADPIFWWSTTLQDLEPNQHYDLALQHGGQQLASAFVETLPEQLPLGEHGAGSDRPFTFWLSSCFAARHSPAGLGELITSLMEDPHARPHLKCLVGDQVYLDELWLFIYSALSEGRLRSRFNRQYAYGFTHPDFARLLAAGGTVFLPDDHELWNNFPHHPFGIPLRGRSFWRTWFRLAYEERCLPIQAPPIVDEFRIGDDLAIFVADVRLQRTLDCDQFMTEGGLRGVPAHSGNIDRLVAWLEALRSPGVLVTQQPVISVRGTAADRKLPDYRQYWRKLLPALHRCSQDLVILSGDVHHGYVATADLTGHDGHKHRLIQIVSSPLSLVSPVAGSIPDCQPRFFPGSQAGDTPAEVEFPMLVPGYTCGRSVRSEEHAMTVAFFRRDASSLGLQVRTRLVRSATQQVGPSWETVLRAH